MVTVIFPAAGASRRMNIKTNKNFLKIGNESILVRTLKTASRKLFKCGEKFKTLQNCCRRQ